jgi:death-on-curing protein
MEESNEHFAILFLGTLEGCIEKIQRILFGIELHPDLYEKAAALMHCLITRSPFENGNKRTGMAAALTFLEMNGIIIDIEVNEGIEFTRKIANSQVDIAEITTWLKAHTRPFVYRV